MQKLNDNFRKVIIEKLEAQQSNIENLKSFLNKDKLISEEEIKNFENIKNNIIEELNDIDDSLKIESEYVKDKNKEILEQIKKDLLENKEVYIYDGELLKVDRIESNYLSCHDDSFQVDIPLTTLYGYEILYEEDLY